MALSERSRTAIYQGLSTVIGDEQAVQEMMSHFPASEAEEPITKDFLRAEMSDLRADLRGEMSELRTELRGEMSELRTELRGEMSELRGDMSELRGEMSELRGELRGEMSGLVQITNGIRTDLHRVALLNLGTLVAFAGVIVAAVRL